MLEKKIFVYIYEELKKKKPLLEEDGREFLQYVGLDRENVRHMLHVERPVVPLSEQDYRWNHIYGKNSQLDLGQYIRKSNEILRNILESKKEEIMKRIDEFLISAITRKGDVFFVLQLLERENEAGLYGVLRKESAYDYSYLKEVNKRTYEAIEKESIAAQNEWRVFWGKREERVADLLASVDNYVQQNYELLRYEMMEDIYRNVLKGMEIYWIEFPEGILLAEMKEIFEKSRILAVFEQNYLSSLNIQQALHESAEAIELNNFQETE